MKNLIVFLLCFVGNQALAQYPYYNWPNSPLDSSVPVPVPVVTTVPVVQPIVVQEVRLIPVVENKIIYVPTYCAIYQPVYVGCSYYHKCRLFR